MSALLTSTLLLLLHLHLLSAAANGIITGQDLPIGFSTTPPSTFAFHPVLPDASSTFSLGFLPTPPSLLRLAVVHLPSSTPLWVAPSAAPWRTSTTLLFNGTLLLLDPSSHTALHLTTTHAPGHLLRLLPTSNLQILDENATVLWQSFDHPSDTIVQDQNFTSLSTLSTTRYYMRLGPNFIGLYINFTDAADPLYFRQSVWEIRARIDPSKGPIYARVNSSGGYLGVYQVEGSLVHLVPFSTYNRPEVQTGFWRLTLESDGNLRGYYWNSSTWVAGYEAIPNACDRPGNCGAYGFCRQEGTGGVCSCLDENTGYTAGVDCMLPETGSLCGGGGEYWVLRRKGVALAYRELLGYFKESSVEECERRCERNCSCWGAVYSNATGVCYVMDFPVETLVEEGGQGRSGYFKVRRRKAAGGAEGKVWAVRVAVGAVVGAAVGVTAVVACRVWRRRREKRVEGTMVEGLAPIPYKGLRNSPSFGAVELPAMPRR